MWMGYILAPAHQDKQRINYEMVTLQQDPEILSNRMQETWERLKQKIEHLVQC